MNIDELGEWTERPPERLIMGKYGDMSNKERAVRVYLALALAVPFVRLVVTTEPSAGGAVVALASFGLSFVVGWRAGYETLHVGGDPDRAGNPLGSVDESYSSDPDADPLEEPEGSS